MSNLKVPANAVTKKKMLNMKIHLHMSWSTHFLIPTSIYIHMLQRYTRIIHLLLYTTVINLRAGG